MDKSTIHLEVYKEERFRVPSPAERDLRLWVDRIGEGVSTRKVERLRILGQYCHVAILEGHGIYRSQRYGVHTVQAGDVMLQLPDDPCLYYPYGTWTTRFVTWNGPEADQLYKLGYIARESPIFRDTDMSISQAYDQLRPIMQRATPADALRRKTVLLQMVLGLFDAQHRLSGQASAHQRIQTVLNHIHEQFYQRLSITSLARMSGLSPTHFRRRFREYTGTSPLAYIRELRMAEAQRLLREGFPIKLVAEAVGYPDPFYFIRTFHANVGQPPGAYARRYHFDERPPHPPSS